MSQRENDAAAEEKQAANGLGKPATGPRQSRDRFATAAGRRGSAQHLNSLFPDALARDLGRIEVWRVVLVEDLALSHL